MPNGKLELHVAYAVPVPGQGTGKVSIVYELVYVPDSRPADGAIIVLDARSLLSGASITAQARLGLHQYWFDSVPDVLPRGRACLGAGLARVQRMSPERGVAEPARPRATWTSNTGGSAVALASHISGRSLR